MVLIITTIMVQLNQILFLRKYYGVFVLVLETRCVSGHPKYKTLKKGNNILSVLLNAYQKSREYFFLVGLTEH